MSATMGPDNSKRCIVDGVGNKNLELIDHASLG